MIDSQELDDCLILILKVTHDAVPTQGLTAQKCTLVQKMG